MIVHFTAALIFFEEVIGCLFCVLSMSGHQSFNSANFEAAICIYFAFWQSLFMNLFLCV